MKVVNINDVLKILHKYGEFLFVTDHLRYMEMQNEIANLPNVTPQAKIGHWIEEVDDYGEVMRWHCDTCYEDSGFTSTCKWDFCPNCGAKMVEA